MPNISHDGRFFDVAMSLECVTCGLLGVATNAQAAVLVATHFAQIHPGIHAQEGREWVRYVAPLRCDICNDVVELPYWTHISTPPTIVGPVVDNDGSWLVCDPCHALFAARDLNAMIERNVEIATIQTPGLAAAPQVVAAMRALGEERLRLLFQRWDAGVRDTVAYPSCTICGAALESDPDRTHECDHKDGT